MLVQPVGSLEYVRVPVTGTLNGAAINPTIDVVAMAFMAGTPATAASPGVSDWKTGSWETAGAVHYALCLVGPGGTTTLAVGEYQVWCKVTDSPEIPVRQVGTIVIV